MFQCVECGLPSSAEIASIQKFRSSGEFSDKSSDLLDNRRRRLRASVRTSQGLVTHALNTDYSAETERMQGDDPRASGHIFSYGSFSGETVRPSVAREEVSAMARAYTRRPYIQLFNKLTNTQMEVRLGGSVRVTNDIITRNCEYHAQFLFDIDGVLIIR